MKKESNIKLPRQTQNAGFISVNKKGIVVSVILSIITLGLYQIYWECLLVKNTREVRKGKLSFLGEVLCLILIPCYSWYWWFTRGKSVKEEFSKHGYPANGNGITYLVLGILGFDIISAAIMQNDFNKLPTNDDETPVKPQVKPSAETSVKPVVKPLVEKSSKESAEQFNIPKSRKKKITSLDKLKARSGWLFVLPFVIGFILIYFPIIYRSIILSFQQMTYVAGGGYVTTWVGFDNYANALFTDPDFVKTLVSGFQQMIFDIPAIIIFSLFMAVLLNQKMAGRAVFRAIFFVPVILSTGLMETINAQSVLDKYMSSGISDDSGASASDQIVSSMDIERLFSGMKIGTELVDFVVTWVNNIFNIVNRSGVQMLIFLAGLQSISPAIYESCQMDGATAWETFWKITFPMISPMILVNAVYTVIDAFTTESNTVMAFIDTKYATTGGETLSSAMAWLYFLIVIAIVAAVAGICSAFVFYQRRND